MKNFPSFRLFRLQNLGRDSQLKVNFSVTGEYWAHGYESGRTLAMYWRIALL